MSDYIDNVKLNGNSIPIRDSDAQRKIALIVQMNNGSGMVNAEGYGPVTVDFGTVSSLPVTKSASGLTADMVVIAHEFGAPQAFTGDLTATVGSGTVTLSGSIQGSSTVKLTFAAADTVTGT